VEKHCEVLCLEVLGHLGLHNYSGLDVFCYGTFSFVVYAYHITGRPRLLKSLFRLCPSPNLPITIEAFHEVQRSIASHLSIRSFHQSWYFSPHEKAAVWRVLSYSTTHFVSALVQAFNS
jgi:hypothetical protein